MTFIMFFLVLTLASLVVYIVTKDNEFISIAILSTLAGIFASIVEWIFR